MIVEFATVIAARAGLELGKTMHAGPRPDGAPDLCTAIVDWGGGSVSEFDRDLYTHNFQVSTRGPTGSYHGAREEAFRVHRLFSNLAGLDLDKWCINTIVWGVPQYLGQDPKGRHQFIATAVVTAKLKG